MRMLRTGGALALLLTMASGLAAQEPKVIDRKVPRLEWGIYGGIAPTSEWLGVNEEFTGLVSGVENNDLSGGFGIGSPPIFGTTLSWFFSSLLGVRVHGALMPSEFPTRDSPAVEAFGALGPAVVDVNARAADQSDAPLNNWFADLDLVVRPFTRSSRGWMSSTYLFVGGGVLITDVAGDSDPGDLFTDEAPDVVDAYWALGARFPYERKGATVGQWNGGVGINFFPFGNTLGLFGELGFHGYKAPIETPARDDSAFVFSLVERRSAVTTRLALGLKLAVGDLTPAPAVPVPEATPLAPPPPVRRILDAPPPPEVREEPMRLCVVENGELREVDALFRTASGDTVVLEQGIRIPLSEAHPAVAPAYASSEAWLMNDQPISLQNREYLRFGVPRAISPTQLVRAGEYQEVPLFVETGSDEPYPVVYVPLGPGCRFQPYQLREQIRVKG